MSSRARSDYRRRDRSWERDDRDRDRDRYSRGGRGGSHRDDGRQRTSRSRSPPRRGERERRGMNERRDHGRDRDDERKGRDRRDGRRRDDRRERENAGERILERGEDDRIDSRRSDRIRDQPQGADIREHQSRKEDSEEQDRSLPMSTASVPSINLRPNLDPDAQSVEEDGTTMDATNEDDVALMSMMGLSGFGTTKGAHVEGNQEGSVNIKKMRTWRQYMNRRGGFNRPLDKIK